jgi:hypothetical protein
MAQVVLEILGLITGVGLDGAQFLIPGDTSQPGMQDPLAQGNSLVRLGFGFNPDRSVVNDTMGGRVPSIRVYNDHATKIGNASSSTSSIAVAGQWVDIIVEQEIKAQQPTFLEVDAMDGDMVCLAYIGQTWSDGTKLGWLGDIGRFCGKSWYYSTLHISMTNGTLYTVRTTERAHFLFVKRH